MVKKAASILVAASLASLAACGQKGPLYVPGVPPNAPWPYPESPKKPAPAPERKQPDLPGTSDERK